MQGIDFICRLKDIHRPNRTRLSTSASRFHSWPWGPAQWRWNRPSALTSPLLCNWQRSSLNRLALYRMDWCVLARAWLTYFMTTTIAPGMRVLICHWPLIILMPSSKSNWCFITRLYVMPLASFALSNSHHKRNRRTVTHIWSGV